RPSPGGPPRAPVPAARPRPPASVVLMTATAGSTDDSMPSTFRPPDPPELWAPAAVAAKPTTPAPMTDAPTTARPRIKREGAGRGRGDRVLDMGRIVVPEALSRLWNR